MSQKPSLTKSYNSVRGPVKGSIERISTRALFGEDYLSICRCSHLIHTVCVTLLCNSVKVKLLVLLIFFEYQHHIWCLVGPEGETSNTLFDTLEEWNAYLKAEDIDLSSLEIQPDIKRHLIRRGPSP